MQAEDPQCHLTQQTRGCPPGLRRAPAPRHCRALTGSLEDSQSAPGQAGSSLRPAPTFSLQREARTREHVLSQGRSFAWSACPGIRTLASSLKLIRSSSIISAVASPPALSKTVSPHHPVPVPVLVFVFVLLIANLVFELTLKTFCCLVAQSF